MQLRERPSVSLPKAMFRDTLSRDSLVDLNRAVFAGEAVFSLNTPYLENPKDIALICIPEAGAADARSWCRKACGEADMTIVPAPLTLSGSNMAGPFDVRLVIGESSQQLVGWLMKSGEYLEWRPSIAVLSQSTPEERAFLLRCGFDDVFDTSTMEPLEGTVRISAIWSGFCRYSNFIKRERELNNELTRMSDDGRWSAQQSDFLMVLLDSPNGFARYGEIGAAIYSGSRIAPRRYLKVLASCIRKKLVAGYSLESIRHRGYLLSFDDER